MGGYVELPGVLIHRIGLRRICLTSYQERVREFYREKRGTLPTLDEAVEYMEEEIEELTDGHETIESFLKEAADVMFTLYGVCEVLGVDLDDAFIKVCESNMTKEFTESGKVSKGAMYRAPDLSGSRIRS